MQEDIRENKIGTTKRGISLSVVVLEWKTLSQEDLKNY